MSETPVCYVPDPPPPLDPAERQALAEVARVLKPWSTPSWVPLLAVFSEWTVIGVALLSTFWIAHPLWWVGVAFLVGCRQHGLLILMHEGVHYRFHRNRLLNDLLSDVLCAWPMMITTAGYRDGHLRHHASLHTPADPDWQMRHDRPEWGFPLPLGRVLLHLAWMGLGGGVAAFIRSNRRLKLIGTAPVVAGPLWRRALRGVVVLGLPLLALWGGGLWRLLLLWWAPWFTVLPVIIRLRVIGEHYGLPATHVFDTTRDWSAGRVLDWLLVPWNIRLHLSHHLFPAAPFHHLPAVSLLLRQRAGIGERMHSTVGLTGLFRDLTQRRTW